MGSWTCTARFIDVHSQALVGSWTCTARHGWVHGRAQPGTGGFMDVRSHGRAQPGMSGFMDVHSQAQFIDVIFFPIACFLCFPGLILIMPLITMLL